MELSIALEKACYFPGELLKCLIKVRRLPEAAPGPSAAAAGPGAAAGSGGGGGGAGGAGERLQLHFECSGSERVDPSWVGHLYHPEVTAQKDHKRLVRVILSTGQVPLLEGSGSQSLGSSGREFIVRCRLPPRAPPSYRGNAVRFVYQVVVRGSLALPEAPGADGGSAGPTSAAAAQQQQPQQLFNCQAHSSFVVWPQPDRTSLDRRPSLPAGTAPGAAGAGGAAGGAGAGGAAGGPAAAAAAAAAAAQPGVGPPVLPGLMEGLQEVDLIEYRLGMQALRLRWEEVVVNPDGSRTLLAHTPTGALYPSSSTASQQLPALTAAQACALDSLQLEDRQLLPLGAAAGTAVSGSTAGGGAEDEGEGDAGGGLLRHLTPAQRASMSVRTFNLRAGEYPLVRLVLQPPADGLLQPGGTFGLLLDFRASHGAVAGAAPGSSLQPVCLQVVALLESEEVVLPPHAPSRSSGGITAMRKLHAEQSQLTAHLLAASFVFSIPLTAPPSFRTPMVAHKWLLRFELTLGRPRPNRPAEVVHEQLLWSLPLVVFPPPPAHSGGTLG